ncbi:hypothetical protein B0H13DRAFT_1858754 [Mycena leptocephala]|nr:hypothetical protein B0H13DRAFT_1858754 [Mycena leptocephala]
MVLILTLHIDPRRSYPSFRYLFMTVYGGLRFMHLTGQEKWHTDYQLASCRHCRESRLKCGAIFIVNRETEQVCIMMPEPMRADGTTAESVTGGENSENRRKWRTTPDIFSYTADETKNCGRQRWPGGTVENGEKAGCLALPIAEATRENGHSALSKHFTFETGIAEGHKLVKVGPYSVVRLPAYTGTFLAYLGLLCYYGSPRVLVYGVRVQGNNLREGVRDIGCADDVTYHQWIVV